MDTLLSTLFNQKDADRRVASRVIVDEPGFIPPQGLLVCGMSLAVENGQLEENLTDTLVSFGLLAQSAPQLTERCEPVLEFSPDIEVELEYLMFLAASCKFSVALLEGDDEARWKTAAKKLFKKALETPQYAGNLYPMSVVAEAQILESIGASEAAAMLRETLAGTREVDKRQPITARYEYARRIANAQCLRWADEVVRECLQQHFGPTAIAEVAGSISKMCVDSVKKIRTEILSNHK